MHVGEPEIAALETEGQLRVFEAEQMKDGRVKVMHVGAIFRCIEPEFVGLAQNETRLSRRRRRTTS